MKRRHLIALGIGLTLVPGAILLDPTYVLIGLLKNERFYQSRPTTYWSQEIQYALYRNPEVESASWFKETCTYLGIPMATEKHHVAMDELRKDRAAVPVLRELLQDRDQRVRWWAALAPALTFEVPASELVPVLAEALIRAEDGETRSRCVAYLEEFGPEAEPAIPALIEALADQWMRSGNAERTVSHMAHRALYRLEKAALRELIGALQSRNSAIRTGAAKALGMMGGDAAEALPDLTRALDDDAIRGEVALAIWRIDIDTPLAVPALRKALKASDPSERRDAAYSLGEIGLDSVSAVPALIEALQDDDPEVRYRVATALGKIGPEAALAMPALARMLRDEERYVRWEAVEAIGNIALNGETIIPALVESLQDQDTCVRRCAASALGRLRPAAKSAIPALEAALKDPEIAGFVKRALWEIEITASDGAAPNESGQPNVPSDDAAPAEPSQPTANAAGPLLLDDVFDARDRPCLSEEMLLPVIDPAHQAEAAELLRIVQDSHHPENNGADERLGKLPVQEDVVVPLLINLLNDLESRSLAIDALARLGPRASSAGPALQQMLDQARYFFWQRDHPCSVDRSAVLRAIWRINRQPAQVVPQLIELLKYTYERFDMSYDPTEILKEIGPEARAAVAGLIKVLQLTIGENKRDAVIALGNIGPDARAAIPALRRAVRDRDSYVCKFAQEALRKIESPQVHTPTK